MHIRRRGSTWFVWNPNNLSEKSLSNAGQASKYILQEANYTFIHPNYILYKELYYKLRLALGSKKALGGNKFQHDLGFFQINTLASEIIPIVPSLCFSMTAIEEKRNELSPHLQALNPENEEGLASINELPLNEDKIQLIVQLATNYYTKKDKRAVDLLAMLGTEAQVLYLLCEQYDKADRATRKKEIQNLILYFTRERKVNIEDCFQLKRWAAQRSLRLQAEFLPFTKLGKRIPLNSSQLNTIYLILLSLCGFIDLIGGVVLLFPIVQLALPSMIFFAPLALSIMCGILFLGLLHKKVLPFFVGIYRKNQFEVPEKFEYNPVEHFSQPLHPLKKLFFSLLELPTSHQPMKAFIDDFRLPWKGVMHIGAGSFDMGYALHQYFSDERKKGTLNLFYGAATILRGLAEITIFPIIYLIKMPIDLLVGLGLKALMSLATEDPIAKHKAEKLAKLAHTGLRQIKVEEDTHLGEKKPLLDNKLPAKLILTDKEIFEIGAELHRKSQKPKYLSAQTYYKKQEAEERWGELYSAYFFKPQPSAAINQMDEPLTISDVAERYLKVFQGS